MQTLFRRIAILLVACGWTLAAHADLKITTQNTMAGQTTQGTTYMKGSRIRTEQQFGPMHQVTITQCDRRQTITVSDACRTYMVAPMDEGESGETVSEPPPPSNSGPTRRGGTITINNSSTNTGETKQMFGYTARHIKSHMSLTSSPDACNPNNVTMESDGWYADFSAGGMTCSAASRPQNMGRIRPDCQDRIRFTGTGMRRLGHPMDVTTTMESSNGTFTMSQKTLELSKANLDPALFEVPSGYQRVDNYQGLMCRDAMSGGGAPPPPPPSRNSEREDSGLHRRGSGTGALCVAPIANRTTNSVDSEMWRDALIDELQRDGVESVKLDAREQFDLRAEAYEKGCGHILYTDVNELKAPSTARRYGHAVGAGNSANYQSLLHVYLMPTNDFNPWLDTDINGTGNTADNAGRGALRSEAQQVSTELSRQH